MPTTLPAALERDLDGLKPAGDQWIARCPLHEDNTPSMTIRMTEDGRVLARCQAGCDQRALADMLKLGEFTDKRIAEWTPRGDAVATYDYRDEAGKLLFQVLRTADKQFSQRRPDPSSKTGWRYSLGDTRRVLFRLPELIAGIADGKSVCIAEGEKDVLALVGAGKVATCNPGGAGKWKPQYAPFFSGAEVTVFTDKDDPGQAHARTIAADLAGFAARVWIVEAADPYKDISAHLAAGLPLSAVVTTYSSDQAPKADLAPDVHELMATEDPDYDWLVDGLLERGERMMLTGSERLGKSMWLRMLAVCMAAGIHPIIFAHTKPLKVLLIDCENSQRQTRRKLGPMVDQAAKSGRPVPDGGLRIILKPNGVDLPSPGGAAWLLERVIAHKPDVLIIGPLYRLHFENPNDESTARRLVQALDVARNTVDCAVLVEAHAGHGAFGQTRSVRPTGSSLYLRWPEFGFGLRADEAKDGTLTGLVRVVSWRGPRDERPGWPTILRRSETGWPWEDASDHAIRRASA